MNLINLKIIKEYLFNYNIKSCMVKSRSNRSAGQISEIEREIRREMFVQQNGHMSRAGDGQTKPTRPDPMQKTET